MKAEHQKPQQWRRGVFNRYRKGMPVLEIFSKDAKHLLKSVGYFIRNKGKAKSLLVYPHYPSSGSTLYKIADMLAYSITNKYHKCHTVAVYWEYLTQRHEYLFLDMLASTGVKVVNLGSRDISKKKVDEIFTQVFGYGTSIDPLTYHGKAVMKSDANAAHDGRVIDCPIEKKEEGVIYQLLIDNSHGSDCVKDLRVPVVKEVLDYSYSKYRAIGERFKNTTLRTDYEETSSLFTSEEIRLLNLFCKEMQLEYGELDVLRDNTTQMIYVVDVNNTPQGPPANTCRIHRKLALQQIATAFQKHWLS